MAFRNNIPTFHYSLLLYVILSRLWKTFIRISVLIQKVGSNPQFTKTPHKTVCSHCWHLLILEEL